MPDDYDIPLSPEYGLAGTAYAKARGAAEKAAQARAWQDLNTAPEGKIFAPGSTPIPDVDREIETRPETADRKNYNEQARGRLAVEREHMAPLQRERDPRKR